jgi:hypothetical protein
MSLYAEEMVLQVSIGVVKMGKIADRFANKRNKVAKPNLLGFYWGYNAAVKGDGFEFNNMMLINQGVADDLVNKIGMAIHEASQAQWRGVMTKDKSLLEGRTAEEFIAEEQQRLDLVVEQMKDDNYICDLETLFHRAMVACCAISTLVAAGRLKQDNYNGDSFMWSKSK